MKPRDGANANPVSNEHGLLWIASHGVGAPRLTLFLAFNSQIVTVDHDFIANHYCPLGSTSAATTANLLSRPRFTFFGPEHGLGLVLRPRSCFKLRPTITISLRAAAAIRKSGCQIPRRRRGRYRSLGACNFRELKLMIV